MSLQGSIVKGNIFREYIAFEPVSEIDDFPVQIINPNISQFHFILAFATENYVVDPNTKKKSGKGNFRANWDVRKFSAQRIKNLKADYNNVKVVISIGGRGTDYPFNPEDKEVWIDSATDSLNDILFKLYQDGCKSVIDGIDINYEYIESNEDDFTYCIGKVIDYLKSNFNGLVVSIAPSHPVLSHYQELYKANTHRVDRINYKYYKEEVSKTHDFVNLHKTLIDSFDVEKLLAGFSTDPNDKGNISLEVFIEGCEQLIQSGSLAGIFVFDAQNSKFSVKPFYVEIKAQKLLVG